MFNKILIANRGEIAIRIIRTCRDMGIKTVAIFSEPDRTSPHVLKADEAYWVGPAPSMESYLNIKKIIEIIKNTSVDALHPGYGFLSENEKFAKQISQYGITWIGPSSSIISMMGDKIKARKLAKKNNVPVVPGDMKSIKNLNDAKKITQKIGFPILVKAAGGGGGKGMRIINSNKELKNALDRAKSEAQKAFADDRIYMEKFLEEPHHIEIQIFSDNHGNCVSLGERECSIQRRYQKIIEETPSPFITSKLRKKLSKSAISIASACNYVGAGTVEFLVDKHHDFYFLEMNTRLQVEHPITETTTGIDLVKEQINVAANKKLSFKQAEINPSGHAIECRIYAEDGFNNFSPSTGTIKEISIPNGIGVRFDEGIRSGQQITPYYDPLLGKLITWGDDRKTAINRMSRALHEFHVTGIDTTIPFCKTLLSHRSFQQGTYCTNTLNTINDELLNIITNHGQDYLLAARIGASKLHDKNKVKFINDNLVSKWSIEGKRSGMK